MRNHCCNLVEVPGKAAPNHNPPQRARTLAAGEGLDHAWLRAHVVQDGPLEPRDDDVRPLVPHPVLHAAKPAGESRGSVRGRPSAWASPSAGKAGQLVWSEGGSTPGGRAVVVATGAWAAAWTGACTGDT